MTKRITEFRVTWTADHAQYFPGHSTVFTEYTDCAVGCGETLREAFEDALESLAQQDLFLRETGYTTIHANRLIEQAMLAELTSQVKKPSDLDVDIVQAECPEQGEHYQQCLRSGDPTIECELDDCIHRDDDPDCAVCAGEWHFYVMVDVKVEGDAKCAICGEESYSSDRTAHKYGPTTHNFVTREN